MLSLFRHCEARSNLFIELSTLCLLPFTFSLLRGFASYFAMTLELFSSLCPHSYVGLLHYRSQWRIRVALPSNLPFRGHCCEVQPVARVRSKSNLAEAICLLNSLLLVFLLLRSHSCVGLLHYRSQWRIRVLLRCHCCEVRSNSNLFIELSNLCVLLVMFLLLCEFASLSFAMTDSSVIARNEAICLICVPIMRLPRRSSSQWHNYSQWRYINSTQLGFSLSINAIFFALFPAFNCFSLAMASPIIWKDSKYTNLSKL